jgi:hypothetical protein|eukprot:TRINITY_DN48116_c0_g1_i1.p1 TRINITY_DN48116_c0_g1~~TRINITY_DN48116_c0_g1_i1.p1  ORF type:complete len:204 (+),score=21.46 TRINITY_DN48116_c0_g1_i1:61-672(+)
MGFDSGILHGHRGECHKVYALCRGETGQVVDAMLLLENKYSDVCLADHDMYVPAACDSDTNTTCDRSLSLIDLDADNDSCCDGHIHEDRFSSVDFCQIDSGDDRSDADESILRLQIFPSPAEKPTVFRHVHCANTIPSDAMLQQSPGVFDSRSDNRVAGVSSDTSSAEAESRHCLLREKCYFRPPSLSIAELYANVNRGNNFD